jgi:membrane-associated phospholipid phosphatase
LTLNPTDKVAITYLIVIALLIVIFSYRIEWWGLFLALHSILITLVILLARTSRPVSPSPPLTVASFFRAWYPIALVPITYKELSYLIPRIHPRDFDSALAAIDYRIFGVHPTVWLERFTWPALTEFLQLTYSTYYFLPVILGAVLWRKGWIDRFHLCVFALVFGFYLSYLGYIAVPAIGPRFLPSIVAAQTEPLMGVLFFHAIRDTLDRAEGITRDCFPSGHTEVTLLVLYYANRFHRRTFWWLLPFASGIIISTVYLRYHYVIDVIAGAILAVVVVLVAKPLYNTLRGYSVRGFEQTAVPERRSH